MEIISKGTKFAHKNIVAIGTFDGLHKAHRSLIGEVKHKAMQCGYKSLVYTFAMPPSVYFTGMQEMLFAPEEKTKAFVQLGIDYLDMQPFTASLAQVEPADFAAYVLEELNAAHIIVGFNFRFGKNAAGTPAFLQDYAKQYGVAVTIIKPICMDAQVISSSQIRKLIMEGAMEQAAQLLGRPYSVQGEVVHGKKLGRKMGFPTANLLPDKGKILPPFGVYVTQVLVGNDIYMGVTNVGNRPTVDDGEQITVETNLLDCDKDLYGQNINVLFLSQLRKEKKFSSIDALQAQIVLDEQSARQYFDK